MCSIKISNRFSLCGTRSRLTLRESPSQECLPPLHEEEDPQPKNIMNSQEPQRVQSAAVCSHKDVGCDGPVLENLGSNRPLVAPACLHIPNGEGKNSFSSTTSSKA